MKFNLNPPSCSSLRAIAVALAIATLPAQVAKATSYASDLTNSAGTVSFRLNDDADTVKVIGNADTLTNELGALPRGLTITNLASSGMTGGVFRVVVAKVGSGVPALIGGSVAFGSPRDVAVNVNPASPRFGRVYVANSATNANNKGDGLFIYQSDLTDTFGQGLAARTGGITNFGTGGAASPYRLRVGRNDDMIYVCDWSDPSGNLYVTDPDITNSTSTSYALQKLTGTAVIPVGSGNNHGSVAAVEVTGSLGAGTLKIFTIDEDYQTDPTATAATEMNSLWEYDVGAGPLPWTTAPNAKLLTPTVNFVSQTMDLSYYAASNYFYVCNWRSVGNEAGVFVVDGAGTLLFNSRDESVAEGNAVDFLANSYGGVAVSPDGAYLAVMSVDNVITIVPMTNGIPNLPARFKYTGFGTTGNGRGIAFDAADNLYIVSSGLGFLQSLSIGITATNTTSSDGTFTIAQPSTRVSAILLDPDTVVTNTLSEADTATFATINIVRTNDDLSGPLGVNFSLTGTATRGTQVTGDYSIRTNGVVITNANTVFIPAGRSSLLVNLVANNDTLPELAESIVFALAGGPYATIAPNSATVSILDDDTNMVDISAVVFNTAFEANTNDFIRYRLQRRGDTNVSTYNVNIGYAGTATVDTDYGSVATVAIDPGAVTVTFDVHPADDALIENTETVIARVLSGTDYLVGTNNALTTNALGTIVDDDLPTETVLFSDNFNVDSSANWTLRFASYTNDDIADYTVSFAYDYASLGIPPAPHSGGGDTLGLFMTVNKDGTPSAAGVNLYPNGKTFSGNFALRFDMYLMQNGSAATTEYMMAGINHDTLHTNWFRNSGNGVAPNWSFDGVWAYVEADGGALGDYVLNSAPAVGTVVGPTALASRLASTLTQTFHQPPWSSGSGAGAPGNTPTTLTPSWAEVEISQINSIITLRINNTVIFAYSNATAFNSGDIMLGYDDAYDSIGGGGGGLVIYDNVRVVAVNPPTIVTQPTNIIAGVGTNVSFYVDATTATGITNYQWLLNGNPIAGTAAASNPYNFGVLPSSFGTYSVRVSDGYYTNLSATATLRPPPPVINTQPANRAAVVGGSPTFSVGATSFSGTATYQWMYYNTNLSGRTAANLTLTNVQLVSFGGPYTVRVNDGFSSVTSSPPATLTFAVSPGITGPAAVGGNFRLSFNTELGPAYVVDFKSALTNAAWVPIRTNAGTGGIINVTNAITGSQGYFRIRLQ